MAGAAVAPARRLGARSAVDSLAPAATLRLALDELGVHRGFTTKLEGRRHPHLGQLRRLAWTSPWKPHMRHVMWTGMAVARQVAFSMPRVGS